MQVFMGKAIKLNKIANDKFDEFQLQNKMKRNMCTIH